MPPAPTSYYPPRARWYSRLYYVWRRLCRRLPLEHVRLPGGYTLQRFLLALAIPGYVYHVRHKSALALGIMAAYAILVLVAFIGLGTSAATSAYAFMIALHALSLVAILEPWLQPDTLRRRLGLTLLSTLVVGFTVYFPLQRWIKGSLVMPLRIGNQALIIIPNQDTDSLRQGVVRVFRFGVNPVRGARLAEGFVVAELLGKPGDRIQFNNGEYHVNGHAFPARPLMPQAGEWQVPENHWFIWPDSSIKVTGALPAMNTEQRDELLRELAIVPSSRLVGRPLRWWFWRNLYAP